MRLARLFAMTAGFISVATWLGYAVAVTGAENLTTVKVGDDSIHQYEGVWAGDENATPFGTMGFAMAFDWEEDGSLYSHSALSKETWVDLRFHKDELGNWVLTESASLAGLGVQKYTMHPVTVSGDTTYWAYLKDPDYLNCRTAASDEVLFMVVNLHGKEHVRFLLTKMQGREADAVRLAMKEASETPGADDIGRLETAGRGEDSIEIQNARLKVKTEPENPQAHLALVEALSVEIESVSPEKMGAYAQEMLASLHKAVELDPELPDAHFSLAQYYLNAPSFAGGSIEKASAEAALLTELSSPLGEVVQAQVEAKQGEREAAVERLRSVLEEYPDLKIARGLYIRLAGEVSSN